MVRADIPAESCYRGDIEVLIYRFIVGGQESILQMAVRIPPFSKKGIRYRRMDVFPTAEDPENKNTCFGITTPLSVLNEQNVSQYVKSIAEPGIFRQYQMRLAGGYFGLVK